MSLSRHLSQEELQALLDPHASEPGTDADPLAVLEESVRMLSARVELLENELVSLQSAAAAEFVMPPLPLSSAPDDTDASLPPRSVKHGKKRGIFARLFE